MAIKFLELSNAISENSGEPRLGGSAFIQHSEWPRDARGEHMTLIFSFPGIFVSELADIDVDPESYVSIFSTYSKDPNYYFLDKVIYNEDDPDELKVIEQNTRVLLHDRVPEQSINLSKYSLPAIKLEKCSRQEKDECFAACGKPVFLQSSVHLPGHQFGFQFYSGGLPAGFQDLLFLSDAIGYVFFKKDISAGSTAGIYFGQCT